MRKRNVLSVVLAGALAVMLFPGGAVEADSESLNRLLKGDYAFSGEASCLVSPDGPGGVPPGGFNNDLTPFGPPAFFPFVNSFTVNGVRTFNGDGTGKVKGSSIGFTHPRPTISRGGAFSTTFEADFTYVVSPDRTTFTSSSPVVNSTTLTGTRAGQTSTVGPVELVGKISKDRKTLTTATPEPAVETLTFSNGDVQHRICHRSRIHIKVRSDDSPDND